MFSIIGAITGLAGPIISLGNKIVDLQKDKVIARTDVEKQEIQGEIELAHDRRATLVAEAAYRLTAIINVVMRTAIASAAAVLLWKLWVWDKVIGSLSGCAAKVLGCEVFRTDPLDANQWYLIIAIVAFYFISTTSFRK